MERRDFSPRILHPGTVEPASGGNVRETFELQRGISRDLAREISTPIRDRFPTGRSRLKGSAVRVTGKSTDDPAVGDGHPAREGPARAAAVKYVP